MDRFSIAALCRQRIETNRAKGHLSGTSICGSAVPGWCRFCFLCDAASFTWFLPGDPGCNHQYPLEIVYKFYDEHHVLDRSKLSTAAGLFCVDENRDRYSEVAC